MSFDQGQITLNSSLSISVKSPEPEAIEKRLARSDGAEITEQPHHSARLERVPPTTLLPPLRKAHEEDDAFSVTTRTDDDPVREAFNVPALDDDDDEEEVIVYQPRCASPIISNLV